GRRQFLRDLLDCLLHVGGLPGARAHELPAAEQEDDHLRLVDPVDEAGELLRLVLDFLQAEGDRDRVQVDLGPEVAGRDDVLDFDHRVLLDRDPGRLDLLRDRVDRKSTRLNSSHVSISYAVFCLKKKKNKNIMINTKSFSEKLTTTTKSKCSK